MKWFNKLFNNKQSLSDRSHSSKRTIGLDSYEIANDMFHNKQIRDEKVLEFYDQAIECGIIEAYGDRAFCLQMLEYHYEAISDFNKAISENMYDSNLYFGRANSKKSLYDLKGSIEDLKMAISLAKIPNKQNEELDERAKSMGWKSAAAIYEMNLMGDLSELKFNEENPEAHERLKAMNTIKRRTNQD